MTLKELVDNQASEEIFWEEGEDWEFDPFLTEAASEYKRHWEEFPKNERHYSKKTGNRLYGRWVYDHRENAGATYNDGMVVHHKDHDKHNNNPNNLMKISQSTHCKIDPNARKFTDCKVPGCKNPHFSHHLCQKHFMQKYRSGKFGSYDKTKNYSKEDR